jgi:hypothetical protein
MANRKTCHAIALEINPLGLMESPSSQSSQRHPVKIL